jgi:Protein of unknown function (DUF3619)
MKQENFAFRIRQALNEGAMHIDYKSQLRLQKAREAALARLKRSPRPQTVSVRVPTLQLAAAGPAVGGPPERGLWRWLRGAGLVAPLVVLVVGFIGIYQWQQMRSIEALANMDFAVLMDETPVETYADRAFSAVLAGDTESN